MATVSEAATTQLEAALKAGLNALDLNQSITFNLYARVILPFDGFAFWVRADLLTPASWQDMLAAANLIETPPSQNVDVMGAMHYASEMRQQEDSNVVINRMIFTAQEEVQDFKLIDPSFLYIADFDGARFAFSSRGSYFKQANLHHYFGVDLDPTLWDMVIDDPADFPGDDAIVSNSLPIWLSLSNYAPAWHVDIPMPPITLWPSFLAGQNVTPPYGTVHIDPEQTTAYQLAPRLNSKLDHDVLARDRVVITLYGCTNRMALDFLDAVNQFTLDTGYMGIVGAIPIVRDDKKTQAEMMIIGRKKRIVFEVSYHQRAVRDLARQLIEKCIVSVYAGQTLISPLP